MLTIEHDRQPNILKLVVDKTVEHLDLEDVLDLLTDVQHYAKVMEEREIEIDAERDADEYGDMYRLRRQ